jgi:hypothetical protein
MWRIKVLGTSLVSLLGVLVVAGAAAVVTLGKLLELGRRCLRHRRVVDRPEPSQAPPNLVG